MEKWDCFTYFNEEEILRMRLEELDDHVDHFIIVEGDLTFTGKHKPMYLDNVLDKGWIQQYLPKIHRARVGLFYATRKSAWAAEYYQRNKILDALKMYEAAPDDIVIISDVDEIPRADILGDIFVPVQLDNTQFFWGPHWQVPAHCNQGARPVVTPLSMMDKTPQQMREADLPRIPNAGWHFSFFKAEESINVKLGAFSHIEYDKPEFKDALKIKRRIELGIDPFDRFPLKWTEIDETFPRYLQRNKDRFGTI